MVLQSITSPDEVVYRHHQHVNLPISIDGVGEAGGGEGTVSCSIRRPTVTADTRGTTQVTSSVSVAAADYDLLRGAGTSKRRGTHAQTGTQRDSLG